MKTLSTVTMLFLFAVFLTVQPAMAGKDLQHATTGAKVNTGTPIQTFAPDGTTTTTLTVNSTTVDLSNYIMYAVESGSGTTCNIRLMPTSAKGAYKQTVIRVAGTHFIRAKNKATPFLNMSGCTAGSYTLQ